MATNFIQQGGVTQPGQRLGQGAVDQLHVTEYGGEVEGTLKKKSFIRDLIPVKPVTGTSVLTNDRVGESSLQAIGRGSVRPDPTEVQFSNIAVKVDTIIAAIATMPLLDEFQNKRDFRIDIGKEHGKSMAVDFDTTFLVQGIKSALHDGTGEPKGWVGGTTDTCTYAESQDPVVLVEKIEDIVSRMEEKEVDMEECVLALRPNEYKILTRNDDLVDRNMSEGNGDRSAMYVMRASGLPIVKTNRLPKKSTGVDQNGLEHELLSNAANGYAYDISEEESKCVALILHPKSLLAGETIPLTSNVEYVGTEFQWYITSHMAYGVTRNRPDHTGALFLSDDWA